MRGIGSKKGCPHGRTSRGLEQLLATHVNAGSRCSILVAMMVEGLVFSCGLMAAAI